MLLLSFIFIFFHFFFDAAFDDYCRCFMLFSCHSFATPCYADILIFHFDFYVSFAYFFCRLRHAFAMLSFAFRHFLLLLFRRGVSSSTRLFRFDYAALLPYAGYAFRFSFTMLTPFLFAIFATCHAMLPFSPFRQLLILPLHVITVHITARLMMPCRRIAAAMPMPCHASTRYAADIAMPAFFAAVR